MSALDKFLHAHGAMRKSGNHWRGSCLACGTSSKSTALSVAEADAGSILVKCFAGGCDADAIAQSVGLQLHDLFPERLSGHHVPGPRRRGLLTANEALDLLKFEAELTTVAAGNLAAGTALTELDRDRLRQVCARIASLYAEVHA
jgi:hypothetical protein